MLPLFCKRLIPFTIPVSISSLPLCPAMLRISISLCSSQLRSYGKVDHLLCEAIKSRELLFNEFCIRARLRAEVGLFAQDIEQTGKRHQRFLYLLRHLVGYACRS